MVSDITMDAQSDKTTVCSFLGECAFIRENQTTMPKLVARTKHNYCLQPAYCWCARFKVGRTLGIGAVPPLMLPGQLNWARQVIEECGQVEPPVAAP